MKRNILIKPIIGGILLTSLVNFSNLDVNAKLIPSNDIEGPAYVIGTHLFTREANPDKGYDGKLSTNLIMLSSQTIKSNDINKMIIYFKTSSGNWINGLTGETISTPDNFDINYTNLKLESENTTVIAPKNPIYYLSGPLSMDSKTGLVDYQLNFYVDDVVNNDNIDGIDIQINQGNLKPEIVDFKFKDNFKSTVTIPEYSNGPKIEGLIKNRKYHYAQLPIKYEKDATIFLESYRLDENGKKVYGEKVKYSINDNQLVPKINIVNDYSNPNYVMEDEKNYYYTLGIKKPEEPIFVTNINDIYSYSIYEKEGNKKIGEYKLDEKFNLIVPKDTYKEYYVQLELIRNKVSKKGAPEIFYIDTRKLTAPILSSNNDNADDVYESILINEDFYNTAAEGSLDKTKEGFELYEKYYENGYKKYRLIDSALKTDSKQVKPENGYSKYIARAYTTNKSGEKVYSVLSKELGVILKPIIEVTESKGKATVKIENANAYSDTNLKYKIYGDNDTVLQTVNSLNTTSTFDIKDNKNIYVRVFFEKDYSRNSNVIKINQNK